MQNQEEIFKKASRHNPFWFVNDLLKIELKDAASFVETIELIEKYNTLRLVCESDIRNLEK